MSSSNVNIEKLLLKYTTVPVFFVGELFSQNTKQLVVSQIKHNWFRLLLSIFVVLAQFYWISTSYRRVDTRQSSLVCLQVQHMASRSHWLTDNGQKYPINNIVAAVDATNTIVANPNDSYGLVSATTISGSSNMNTATSVRKSPNHHCHQFIHREDTFFVHLVALTKLALVLFAFELVRLSDTIVDLVRKCRTLNSSVEQSNKIENETGEEENDIGNDDKGDDEDDEKTDTKSPVDFRYIERNRGYK